MLQFTPKHSEKIMHVCMSVSKKRKNDKADVMKY